MIGWRWETTDLRDGRSTPILEAGRSSPIMAALRHLGSLHLPETERPATPVPTPRIPGNRMGSFPEGGWSERAHCLFYPDAPHPAPHERERAPVADCMCGYRVCTDIQTCIDYLKRDNDHFDMVLVRVRTRGKVVANDRTRNLSNSNCRSVRYIAPAWPAFVTSAGQAAALRATYQREDIHVVERFGDARKLWGQIKSGYPPGVEPAPSVWRNGPGGVPVPDWETEALIYGG